MLSRLFKRGQSKPQIEMVLDAQYECSSCGKLHDTYTDSEVCCGYVIKLEAEMELGPVIPAIVGHGISFQSGLMGTQGSGYDYIMESGGVSIQAKNNQVTARIPIANVKIKGLAPVAPKLELVGGPIPAEVFDKCLDWLLMEPERERFASIVYNPVEGENEYMMVVPGQQGTRASVSYEPQPRTVFEMHSHGTMKAFFSGTDTQDEQGLAIYAVVGNLDYMGVGASLAIRLGVYGYYLDLLQWPELMAQVFQPVPQFIRRRMLPDV